VTTDPRALIPPGWRRLPLKVRRTTLGLLKVQLGAGLGLQEALRAAGRDGGGGRAGAGDRRAAASHDGSTLAEAARSQPELFSEHDAVMLELGEQAGILVEVFGALEDATAWLAELRRKTVGVLVYPAFLLNVAYLCGNVMLVVEGRLLSYLLGWVVLDLVLGGALLAAGWALGRDELRGAVDELVLSTPGLSWLVGRPLTLYHQALFFMGWGRALDAGMDLTPALGAATAGCRSRPLRRDWERIAGELGASTVGEACLSCAQLTPAQRTTITAAEQAGRLPDALVMLGRHARTDLEHWLRQYYRLMPVVMLLIAVMWIFGQGL